MSTLERIQHLPTEADFSAVHQAIHNAWTAEQAYDISAKVAMAKAWAKAHGKAKELRLQLLHAEVECLVRVWELDGSNLLDNSSRRAAKWWAGKTPAARHALIEASGNSTTAAGLANRLSAEERDAAMNKRQERYGRNYAQGRRDHLDDYDYDNSTRPAESDWRTPMEILGAMLDELTDAGEPFTIADVADELIATAELGEDEADDAFRNGVRNVVKHAIRSAAVGNFDGTAIPKLLTVTSPTGGWIRIPTLSATVQDARDALAIRQEQLEANRVAVEKIERFVAKLEDFSDGDGAMNIGDVITKSTQTAA